MYRIFRLISQSDISTLHNQVLRAFFPDSISGHSLRAGGATSLAASGVPFDRIRAMGRWSSDAFRIYVRKNPALLHALVFNGRSIHDPVHPFH
jgi:hypothetical protein